jgi:hemerythrin
MALLEWKDSHSVGVATLDEQHKKIFGLINDLYEGMQKNLESVELKSILKQFADYAEYHFKTEEGLFAEHGYDKKDQHIATHDFYRDKIKEFWDKLQSKEDFLSFKIIDFMEDWWLGHVIGADQQYKEFFASKGVK